MIAWILVGGRLTPTPALAALPRPGLVVAADGGARHAAVLGVNIGAWVGDFDSSDDLNLDVPRTVYPRAKASTDAELAIALAREQGASELVILGAFGGRFDHTFALALGAVRLAQEGLKVTLHSGDERGYPLLPGQEIRLSGSPGQTFSVLAASDLSGLNIGGARWNLHEADVPLGSGLTVSNEFASHEGATGELTLGLRTGTALVTLLEPDF
ncbi:thiamine diphosphokinase [Deinococcus altitudinis]|uniref:thiamine diphosphokinase n=1 Tax=Deinococcus altitudinis TaxID=468914 RepID=UPI003891FD85